MSALSSAQPVSPGRSLSPPKQPARQLFSDAAYFVDPSNPEEAFPAVQLRDLRDKPVTGFAVSSLSAYDDIDSEWIDHEPSFAPRLEKTTPDQFGAGLSTTTYNWDHSTKQRRGAPFADYYHVIRLPNNSGPVEAILAVADGAGWGDEARMAAAIAAKRACSYLCDTLLAKHLAVPAKDRPKLTVSRLSDYLHNSITDAHKAIVQDPFFLKRRIHEEPKGATTITICAVCQLEQPIICCSVPVAPHSGSPNVFRKTSRPESVQLPLTPSSIPVGASTASNSSAAVGSSASGPSHGAASTPPIPISVVPSVLSTSPPTSPHTSSSPPAITGAGTPVQFTPSGPQPLGPDRFDRVIVSAAVGNCGAFLRQRSGRIVPVTRRPSNRDSSDPGGLLGWVWGGKKGAYWPQEANNFLLDEPTDPDLVALFKLARNKKGNAYYGNLHFSMIPCRQGDVLLLGSDGLFENLMRVAPPMPLSNDPLAMLSHQLQYAQKQAHILEELMWNIDRTPVLHALRRITEHLNELSAPARRKEEETSRSSAFQLKHSSGSSSSGSLHGDTPPSADKPAPKVPPPQILSDAPFGFLDHVTMVALRIERQSDDDEELEITMRAHELYGEPAGVSPWDPRRMSKQGC